MKGCLASGYPFVFGFTVYRKLRKRSRWRKTGIVPMPAAGESVLGGHAVLAVGYDDSQQRFIVRNSWGTGWGMQGYFTMPYAYLTERNLASDFWTIRLVQGLTQVTDPRARRPRVRHCVTCTCNANDFPAASGWKPRRIPHGDVAFAGRDSLDLPAMLAALSQAGRPDDRK